MLILSSAFHFIYRISELYDDMFDMICEHIEYFNKCQFERTKIYYFLTHFACLWMGGLRKMRI